MDVRVFESAPVQEVFDEGRKPDTYHQGRSHGCDIRRKIGHMYEVLEILPLTSRSKACLPCPGSRYCGGSGILPCHRCVEEDMEQLKKDIRLRQNVVVQ